MHIDGAQQAKIGANKAVSAASSGGQITSYHCTWRLLAKGHAESTRTWFKSKGANSLRCAKQEHQPMYRTELSTA